MRSLYKISLALLAVGFLAVAGIAHAQDMAKPTFTITGDIGSSFGVVSVDKQATTTGTLPASQKAFSEWTTSYEANIRFTWATDQFTVIGRLRSRANTEGDAGIGNTASGGSTIGSGSAFASNAEDIYNEVWWTPGAFKLGMGKFQGQGWSQPFSGAYVILSPIETIGSGSSNEYFMNWTGIPGLDAEYNLGPVQIGLALSSLCRPSCNLASSASNSASNAVVSGTQTIVPHVTGKFGDISFAANAPQTSALISAKSTTSPFAAAATPDATETKTASGSGIQAGVKWSGPAGLAVSADFENFVDTKIADLGEKKDRTRTGIQAKVDAPAGPGVVTVAYFQLSDNNSSYFNGAGAAAAGDGYGSYGASNTYTSTKTTVRYSIPISFGWIMPEYVAHVAGGGVQDPNKSKDKDLNINLIRVIMQGKF